LNDPSLCIALRYTYHCAYSLHHSECFQGAYPCVLYFILLSLFIEISFDFLANLIPFTQRIKNHFQEEEVSLCILSCVAFYHQLIISGYKLLSLLNLKRILNFCKKKKLLFV